MVLKGLGFRAVGVRVYGPFRFGVWEFAGDQAPFVAWVQVNRHCTPENCWVALNGKARLSLVPSELQAYSKTRKL